MLCVDVNVLVYGLDASSRRHEQARDLLERQRSASELTLLLPEVVSGLLRVMTDRRIFTAPAEPSGVLADQYQPRSTWAPRGCPSTAASPASANSPG